MQEEIIEHLYNLILDPTLSKEERSILIQFKNQLNPPNNTNHVILDLAEAIRLLSIKNITDEKTLSPKLAEFYQKIAYYGEREKTIARGISSFGMIR